MEKLDNEYLEYLKAKEEIKDEYKSIWIDNRYNTFGKINRY